MGKPTDLVQGTLDLLILPTIEHQTKHDWAIAKRILQALRTLRAKHAGPCLRRVPVAWLLGE